MQVIGIGKIRALSEVTCNFRLYLYRLCSVLKLGRTSVTPSWNHWIFTSKCYCLHTGISYNTAYGWNRPTVKPQCSLLTYSIGYIRFCEECPFLQVMD